MKNNEKLLSLSVTIPKNMSFDDIKWCINYMHKKYKVLPSNLYFFFAALMDEFKLRKDCQTIYKPSIKERNVHLDEVNAWYVEEEKRIKGEMI